MVVVVVVHLLAPTTLAYAVANTCAATTYGCCPDGKTPAAGPHQAGCPGKDSTNIQRYHFFISFNFTDILSYTLSRVNKSGGHVSSHKLEATRYGKFITDIIFVALLIHS